VSLRNQPSITRITGNPGVSGQSTLGNVEAAYFNRVPDMVPLVTAYRLTERPVVCQAVRSRNLDLAPYGVAHVSEEMVNEKNARLAELLERAFRLI
jgi:hypothetical protein